MCKADGSGWSACDCASNGGFQAHRRQRVAARETLAVHPRGAPAAITGAPDYCNASIDLPDGGLTVSSTGYVISPASTVPSSDAGQGVDGSVVYDGVPVILHGVNRSGTEYQCTKGTSIFDGPDDENSVKAIASWNVNAVRIPLNETCWLTPADAPPLKAAYSGTAYKQAIQRYVNLLHKHDIYPILELHWVAYGTNWATGQLPMPDAEHAVDFWKDVTAAFKDDLGVIFELFNEPFPGDGVHNSVDNNAAWDCWKNDCSTAAPAK